MVLTIGFQIVDIASSSWRKPDEARRFKGDPHRGPAHGRRTPL